MRPISILGLAAAAAALVVASSAAQAGYRRAGYAAAPSYHAAVGGFGHRHIGFGGGYGVRHAGYGFRHRAIVPVAAAAAVIGGAAYGTGYSGDYAYAQPGYDATPSYGYAQSAGYGYAAPATQTWSRTYAVPQTVMQPVTRTHLVPVTSYRAVQSTQYVPTTGYRNVTKTCSCTIDGVTTQVPCAGGIGAGYGYNAGGYVQGVSHAPLYNRPGLFTSDAW